MNRIEWSREAVLTLIEIYKKNPCLWDNKHVSYKNRERNKEAVSKMTEAVKPYHPEVTDEDCRTKYQNLRGQFSKEYAKLLTAKEESGADVLPKAKFWCFYRLWFLKDCIRQKPTKLEVCYKDTNSISGKTDNEYCDENRTHKMDYSVDDNKSYNDDDFSDSYSVEVEYLDHTYAEYDATEIGTSKKRKLDEYVPTSEQNLKIKNNKRNSPSLSEILSTDLEINMKQNNEEHVMKINKNTKIGELLTETLNECHNKEKRKWAQKEVLNIITSLIDVDSDLE